MALPLLLGLAGSGLAGAGMLGGMGALTAGAIGSGLGSYLETGDLGQGIQTGLLSFLGGKALGSVMGGASGAGEAASAATQAPLPGSLQANVMQQANPATAFTASAPSTVAASAPATTMPSVFNTTAQNAALGGGNAAASEGFMSNLFSDPTAGQAGSGLSGALGAVKSPYALGAAGSAALPGLLEPKFDAMPKKTYDTAEAEAADRQARTPGANFRPGVSPEFDYFGPMKTSFADGGLAALRYQEGGDMDRSERIQDLLEKGAQKEMRANDKEIISNAVKAIQGMSETPEQDLGQFLSRYGEGPLRDLVERVQSGAFEFEAMKSEGQINGVGDGMDDMIPATLEGEQDVVLSDGEFIVPADVVSGLGNGSSNAGSKALYEMMDRVREMRTGQKEQPEQVPQGMMLPA